MCKGDRMYNFVRKISILLLIVLFYSCSGISVFAEFDGENQEYISVNDIRSSEKKESYYENTDLPIRVETAKKVENWIYYKKTSYNYGLSRVSKNQKSKPIDYGGTVSSFQQEGQWVYYTNADDGNRLYRVKSDGTNSKRISKNAINDFVVSGDWIVFTVNGESKLNRMKADGTLKSTVLNKGVINFKVYGNTIVYSDWDGGISSLHTVNINGKGDKKLTNDSVSSFEELSYIDGWLFYVSINNVGDRKIVKIKPDGTKKQVLKTLPVGRMDIHKGWIYYSESQSNKLFKIKPDGTGNKRVTNWSVGNFRIGEGYVYYQDEGGKSIFKRRFDGTGKLKVCDFSRYDFEVVGDSVYFYDDETWSWIKVKANGKGNKERVTKRQMAIDYNIANNKWIWYLDSRSKEGFYRLNTSDNTIQEIVRGGGENYTVYGEYLYYTDYDGVHKVKLDGTGKKTLLKEYNSSLIVSEDWICSYDRDKTIIYLIKISDNKVVEKVNVPEFGFITVNKGWVYYKDDYSQIKRMNLATKKTENFIEEDVTIWELVDDNIFYSSGVTGDLMRKSLDGSRENTVISNETTSVLISDGWVYYSNQKDGSYLYRVRYDGSEKTKILSKVAYPFNVLENWIFYTEEIRGKNLYKVKVDGSKDSFLLTGEIYNFELKNNTLFYSTIKETGLYILELETMKKRNLPGNDWLFCQFEIIDNTVFYTKGEYPLKADTYMLKIGEARPKKL